MEIYFQVVTVVLVLSVILLTLALCRNSLVFCVRNKAIDYVAEHRLSWFLYESVSYEQQMWDLRKWTFADFYPQYVERDEHEQF